MYQSGTRPELEVEMGLIGALIVRPTGFAAGTHELHPDRIAYMAVGSSGYQPTHYDREYLFLLSEMDRALEHHELMKVRVNAEDRESRDAMVASMCEAMHAELVQRIGHIAVLYRAAKEPRLKLP